MCVHVCVGVQYLEELLDSDINYDLAAYWRFLGDTPDEITAGFASMLDENQVCTCVSE